MTQGLCVFMIGALLLAYAMAGKASQPKGQVMCFMPLELE